MSLWVCDERPRHILSVCLLSHSLMNVITGLSSRTHNDETPGIIIHTTLSHRSQTSLQREESVCWDTCNDIYERVCLSVSVYGHTHTHSLINVIIGVSILWESVYECVRIRTRHLWWLSRRDRDTYEDTYETHTDTYEDTYERHTRDTQTHSPEETETLNLSISVRLNLSI